MDKTTTLRALALNAATDRADQLLQRSHERNYHTLYVSRDGNVFWAEDINSDSLIIDDTASDLRSVHVITQVGTGSVDCNCGACDSDHSDSLDYAITLISDAFMSVPTSYFNDEPIDAGNEGDRDMTPMTPMKAMTDMIDQCYEIMGVNNQNLKKNEVKK